MTARVPGSGAPLVCLECGSVGAFLQVAAGQRRTIRETAGHRTLGEWTPAHPADGAGLSCADCGEFLTEHVPSWAEDDRVDVVSPGSVSYRELAGRLEEVIGADWGRLERSGRPAILDEVPTSLGDEVADLLRGRYPEGLYRHQAEAIRAAMDGRHVVQATAAGSGKSLGFLAPLMDSLVRDPRATALIVYPSTSLVGDQYTALEGWATASRVVTDGVKELTVAGSRVVVSRYDGGLSSEARTKARRDARLILTTPDSLHQSLLQFARHEYADGTSWDRFFRGLRWIVLDEVHLYSGSFGSAVSMVMRRCARVAGWHLSSPQFLASSATIGNPGELVSRLTGVDDVHVVGDSGAPVHPRLTLTAPPGMEGRDRLIAGAVERLVGEPGGAPVRTLVFADSRSRVQQLRGMLRRRLQAVGWGARDDVVVSIVGTMDSKERGLAESALRDGTALVVVGTSALEVGIDVASIGAVIMDGLPRDAASFEQRAGRAGRVGDGLAIVLPGDRPLERALTSDTESLQTWLDEASPTIVIAEDNPDIVRLFGLVPAQTELGGIALEDREFFGPEPVEQWLTDAIGAPVEVRHGVPYFENDIGTGDRYQPLRGGGESFQLVSSDGARQHKVARFDRRTAMVEAFPGAVVRDGRGRPHRVRGYRLDEGLITATPETSGDAPYTRAVMESEVDLLEELAPAMQSEGTTVRYRSLRLTYSTRYARVVHGGHATWEPLDRSWPPLTVSSVGVEVAIARDWFVEGDSAPALNAVRNALVAAAPALVACDLGDLSATLRGRSVILHDAEGTIGWSRPLKDRFPLLASQALTIVSSCDCETDGCPRCVQGYADEPTSRLQAQELLYRLSTCWF